jgi:hypothetical protein
VEVIDSGTLAYYELTIIAVVKSFVVEACGVFAIVSRQGGYRSGDPCPQVTDMTLTNTPAYFGTELVTAVRSFIVDPWS